MSLAVLTADDTTGAHPVWTDGSALPPPFGPTPPATGSGTGIFGDGSDGTATCDGSTAVAGMTLAGGVYTMNRNVYFTSLTINTGVAVLGAGFIPFCLALACNGHLNVDGGAGGPDASAGAGGGSGPAAGAGGLPVGTAVLGGGAGGIQGGSSQANVLNSLGGAGGASNLGGPYLVTAVPAYLGSVHDLTTAIRGYGIGILSGSPVVAQFNGGQGGAGGGAGGQLCGGGSGGALVVVAETLTGTGHISADGGAGAADATNGTGGGGGGWVALIARTSTGWSGTVTANGGAAAAVGGGAGANGTVVQLTA